MPPFQDLTTAGNKRKLEYSGDASRKRLAMDGESNAEKITDSSVQCWMVQWRVPQQKKHKTWDGDAVLVLHGANGTLYDLEGMLTDSGRVQLPISEGKVFRFAGKDMELDRSIAYAEYASGICFGRGSFGASSAASVVPSTSFNKKFTPVRPSREPGLKHTSSCVSEKKGLPLQAIDLISVSDNSSSRKDMEKVRVEDSYWIANWRKQQNRKHKTWDGDAYVSKIGDRLTLISEEGKIMGVTAWKGQILQSGYLTYIGGKEVELDVEVSASQLPAMAAGVTTTHSPQMTGGPPQPLNDAASSSSAVKKFVAPISFYGAPAKPKEKGPLHDPTLPDAVVMKAPTKEHMKKFNKKDYPVVPVVLDPILARHMRPHQKEGVKFLYECVMGLRKHEGQGCILADEMGLGKTLQTISLVWTLLKQNPYAGTQPVVSKVLVVCPVSLVKNWKMEFHKWLGKDRVGVVTWGDKNALQAFTLVKSNHVLVLGYERLKTVIGQLTACIPPIGLIICDEGHRLKSANNKTVALLNQLRTPRRIILSGTPIQNDLGEFHAMANFCNPGLLDDYNTFRRVYEAPILKSREPNCSLKETELGEARSAQLLTVGRSFVLRRDASLLENYLPPKFEYVVFVTPTPLQLSIFSKILNPDKLENLMQSSTAESLALINMLTKISNSPILLKATADKAKAAATDATGDNVKKAGVEEALKLLPEKAQIEDMSLSGKLTALSSLLRFIRKNTEEKCVLVSHYTSSLNILEAFCKKSKYNYYRLDGQTPAPKRQEYVNLFNKSSQQSSFLFLLSSKAGGVGINLIGASRLCLIDSDWNPSHDLQSMARIHRDGQKRPVFIYRFLTAGTIDEKIYQRQVTKLGLSDSLMGSEKSGSKSDSFSRKDLRDIFRVHPDTPCNTHDLLDCSCDGSVPGHLMTRSDRSDRDDSDVDVTDEEESESERGFMAASEVRPHQINKMDKAFLRKKKADLAALDGWKHINCLRSNARSEVQDNILRKLIYARERETEVIPPSKPKSRIDSLLSVVDIESITGMDEGDERLSVHDVPGGTVSFLFERGTKTFSNKEVELIE